ncbi:nuclease-related domain-containing protein [Lacticigenium naphthae]|uniref:nuclease-related domain-containing protein n=1 Tax=Lacticigenium naphthae TaxID=515351 RepID=UPI0003FEAD96|nr:nuclease-related domain-containing protein [Lacticigenium naphthae]
MLLKSRTKPNQLLALEYLTNRIELKLEHKNYLTALQKGFAGEKQFDQLTNKLNESCLVLQDLHLELNHSHFQIDTLILTNEQVYLYEIKNYTNKYYCKDDKWFRLPEYAIDNPQAQLEKCKSKLEILLRNWNCHLPIQAKLVFVNPSFILYHAPMNPILLFASEIGSHLNELENPSHRSVDSRSDALAKRLIAKHNMISQNFQTHNSLPDYTFETVKKGLRCPTCQEIFTAKTHHQRQLTCPHCSSNHSIKKLFEQACTEYEFLFSQKPLTFSLFDKWTGGCCSSKRIQRYLGKTYLKEGQGKATIYVRPLHA